MKKAISVISGMLVACACVAGVDFVDLQQSDVTTNATLGSVTNNALVHGEVIGVAIDVTGLAKYRVTNGTIAVVAPTNVVGAYFDNGSAGVSTNHYVEDGGTFDLWFTNGYWHLGSTLGTTNNTYTNATITGRYLTNSILVAGTPVVQLWAPDVDIDIVTTTNQGQGSATERTIYSADDVTASAFYRVRVPMHTTGGSVLVTGTGTTNAVPIPLAMDRLKLTASDSDATGVTVKAHVYVRN